MPKPLDTMSKSNDRINDMKEIVSTVNQSSSVDVMSPYNIHASDKLGQVYVYELYDGNYMESFDSLQWEFLLKVLSQLDLRSTKILVANNMSTVLFAKNKIGFGDG